MDERGHQVRLMAQIYGSASGLLVWLGEPNHDTKETPTQSHALRWPCSERYDERYLKVFEKHLCELGERSWFTRKWVLQEYILTIGRPRTMLVGGYALDARLLNIVLRLLTRDSSPYPLLCRDDEAHHFPLLYGLYNSSDLQCSDGLDHVYALCVVAIDGSTMQVNYNQSVRELYKDLALSQTGSSPLKMRLLACATAFPNPDWPSWVPDWTRKRPYDLPNFYISRYSDPYKTRAGRHAWPAQSSMEVDVEKDGVLSAQSTALPTPPRSQHHVDDTLPSPIVEKDDKVLITGFVLPPCRFQKCIDINRCISRRLRAQRWKPGLLVGFSPESPLWGACLLNHEWSSEDFSSSDWKWSREQRKQFTAMRKDRKSFFLLPNYEEPRVAYILSACMGYEEGTGYPVYRLESCFLADDVEIRSLLCERQAQSVWLA